MFLRDYQENDGVIVAAEIQSILAQAFAETHKMTPAEGVKFCIDSSTVVKTVINRNGEIAGITGCSGIKNEGYKDCGFCWMLSTRLAVREPRGFMRASRDIMRLYHGLNRWSKFITFVDSNFPASKRWLLDWLYFEEVKEWPGFGYVDDRPFYELVHHPETLKRYDDSGK